MKIEYLNLSVIILKFNSLKIISKISKNFKGIEKESFTICAYYIYTMIICYEYILLIYKILFFLVSQYWERIIRGIVCINRPEGVGFSEGQGAVGFSDNGERFTLKQTKNNVWARAARNLISANRYCGWMLQLTRHEENIFPYTRAKVFRKK